MVRVVIIAFHPGPQTAVKRFKAAGNTGQAGQGWSACCRRGIWRSRHPAERRTAMTWARPEERAFKIDMGHCSACGGAMKVIACIEDPVVIKQLLFNHLKHRAETSEPRALPESRAPLAELPQGLFD